MIGEVRRGMTLIRKPLITKLYIKCPLHSKQIAVPVCGGEIWCKKCQIEYLKWKEKVIG